MKDDDKQAMIELIHKQLDKHWEKHPDDDRGMYSVVDDYDRNLVKQAVNFILGDHYRCSLFDFEEPRFYDWHDQGVLAIISMFCVDQRETFGLTDEMFERARHLMVQVRNDNVPRSLIRVGASL